METTITNPTKTPTKFDFGWLIPLYILALIGAYVLALSAFPVTIDKDKILGITLSKEQGFNQPLFLHLSIGIFYIALVQLISRQMNVKLSIGNAILAFLLVINIFCYIIGINVSLLNITRLWIIKEHLSLIQVLSNLKLKGELHLYYIMLIFTFILPILKMMAMSYDVFLSKTNGRKYNLVSFISKWAMLDVMIIGVIVVTMKSDSGFANMTTGTGLSYFFASIILSMVITNCLQLTKNQ